jgi:hypothetical protein
MVIDYRALNEITIKDYFPLTLSDELTEKLQGKKFFSKFDVYMDYDQGHLALEDIEKIAVVSADSLLE